MKLIIQIPCYNEAGTLAIALGALPREVTGFDKVEWLIINDGSTDNTVKVAKECGVDHIVNFKHNQGLAKGLMTGNMEVRFVWIGTQIISLRTKLYLDCQAMGNCILKVTGPFQRLNIDGPMVKGYVCLCL